MKEIQLTRGLSAIVDDVDAEYLCRFKWYADRGGYARTNISRPDGSGRETVRMHRMILGLEIGEEAIVDHIDLNRLNNQRANLRVCTRKENSRNRGNQANNTSGLKGVSWHKSARKWCAQIKVAGKKKYLGVFATPELAHEAYRKAALELHGAFANFGE
jgi:hypothetical protein